MGAETMGRRTAAWIGAVAALALAGCAARTGDEVVATPPTSSEAARFLTQATFGPTETDVARVKAIGYAAWIDEQLAQPVSGLHVAEARERASTSLNDNFYSTFWRQAVTGPDQLRQRTKFALSEIFVISLSDTAVDYIGASSFYDMLGANAFGNYRTLLEQVTLHPMMGRYLTWLGNQKEDPATGRTPDENYAREVMQLMSIGLVELNLDGTPKRDAGGRTIPTYDADDIAGLARVFTGYSWYSPTPSNNTFAGRNRDPDSNVRPMIAYPAFHSTSAKAFLGATISASPTPNPAGDLRIALDTLFNHPNTGPFISRQLIQRLVTSNPSPAYVERVARVFNNNGRGVRGDLAAVVRAILLDSEARDATAAFNNPNFGKLREPVIRMTHLLRASQAESRTGIWWATTTSANTSLSQSPLTSPSVFNFFRPGYVPPNTRIGAAGLVGPELQIVDEVTTAGYLNTLQDGLTNGMGTASTINGVAARDIQLPLRAEVALARQPSALIDRVDLLYLNGRMSMGLRTRITEAVNGVAIPGGTATDATINAALRNRARLAIYMAMASPEYVVQR